MNYLMVFLIIAIFLLVSHYVIKIFILKKDDDIDESPVKIQKRVRFSRRSVVQDIPGTGQVLEESPSEEDELLRFMDTAIEQASCGTADIPMPSATETTGTVASGPSVTMTPGTGGNTMGSIPLSNPTRGGVVAAHPNGMIDVVDSVDRVEPLGLGETSAGKIPGITDQNFGNIIPWEQDTFESFGTF
jgi:hypothetical protein